MEENSFAAVNAKKNHFVSEKRPALYSKFEHPLPPPIPPTHFTNKIIACPEGHFIVTPHFNKFVLTAPLLIMRNSEKWNVAKQSITPL